LGFLGQAEPRQQRLGGILHCLGSVRSSPSDAVITTVYPSNVRLRALLGPLSVSLCEKETEMANRVSHQDVVKKLLDTKAVDFGAIGKAVAELGPAMSLADEPWEGFCGTMRIFIRIFIIHGPRGPLGPIENLADLSGAAKEL